MAGHCIVLPPQILAENTINLVAYLRFVRMPLYIQTIEIGEVDLCHGWV